MQEIELEIKMCRCWAVLYFFLIASALGRRLQKRDTPGRILGDLVSSSDTSPLNDGMMV